MKPPNQEKYQRPPRPTKWQVFTGAPCSGKTSVIKALENSGHRVVHEFARTYMEQCLAQGTPIDKIKSDTCSFERRILQAKFAIEQRLPGNQPRFMDRAVPDSIAYYRLEGLSIKEPLYWSQAVRYQHIFLFERLAFEKDCVRKEDQERAMHIEKLLIEAYESLGYDIIRVPRFTIDERMAFVLNHIENHR